MADGALDPAMEAYLADLNKKYQMYYPVAFWVEAIIYGLYVSMFISTCRIMLKKKPAETVASRVFLVVSIMIFILATIHNVTSISRLIRAYSLLLAPPAPYLYFQDYKQWDNYAHLLITAFCTWLGDILVIYRCYLIWRKSRYIIILPSILLLGSIATTFFNWYYFQHPDEFDFMAILPVFYMTFPLNLAQNVLTTSLIAWKIYMQHRETMRSGLQLSAGLDLVGVIRIIVESAMVYTVETLIIIVLFFLNHPAVVIVQHALPPSTGIVFCLIAIRTHVARADSVARGPSVYASNAFFPTWLSDNNEGIGPRRNNHIGPITVTTVTEQHRLDVLSSPRKREHGHRETNNHVSYRDREIGSKDKEMTVTMDVDLDVESDSYPQGSPESVLTFDREMKS